MAAPACPFRHGAAGQEISDLLLFILSPALEKCTLTLYPKNNPHAPTPPLPNTWNEFLLFSLIEHRKQLKQKKKTPKM